MRIYLSVCEGEMRNCWCESSEWSISFFLRQANGDGETWNDGTHLTTSVKDKTAVFIIVEVLTLIVEMMEVMIEILVDALKEVLVAVLIAVLNAVTVLVDMMVNALKKGLLT